MNWLTDIVRPKIKKTTPKEIADDLWTAISHPQVVDDINWQKKYVM